MWELPPYGAASRRLVFLGSADRAAELSKLVWSRGDADFTPFTQYLINVAKVRYEERVRFTSEHRLADGSDTEQWLEAMSVTVDIARANMSACLRAAGLDADPATGALADDFEVAAALRDQLTYDVRYARHVVVAAELSSKAATRAWQPPIFGLLTALPEEFAAVRALIDNPQSVAIEGDRADYVCGTMPGTESTRPHPVVLTMIGETGTPAAAHAVANLLRSFDSVDQVVMVGIAAGVPNRQRPEQHVRLGDIVAATWNIVDFDNVVDTPAGPQRRQEFPRRSALLGARAEALAIEEADGERRPWEVHLAALLAKQPKLFRRPDPSTDVLYADDRDTAAVVPHPSLEASGHRVGYPKVHLGRIGSSDRSMRNAESRDAFARRHQLRAIEMEGAGVGWASFAEGRESFVIRGISDYGDARVGKLWRPYAAAVAAAYLRALLSVCRPLNPHGGRVSGLS